MVLETIFTVTGAVAGRAQNELAQFQSLLSVPHLKSPRCRTSVQDRSLLEISVLSRLAERDVPPTLTGPRL